MEIKLQTLTPIWTGGIDAGKCDRIHETGILGSLRWWIEVLARGVGGNVCDPTEQKCSYQNGLCDVCKVFGAEGQKRRFRLEIFQDNIKFDKDISSKIELQPYQHQYKDKQGKEQTGTRIPTWYFPKKDDGKPKSGTLTIHIQSLHPDFNPEIIAGLIQFIADLSALGARPQMGFGVIKVEGDLINTRPLYNWLIDTAGNKIYQELPSLQNIFLAQIQPRNANSSFIEQDIFNLKYDLRNCFRTEEVIRAEEQKTHVKSESKSLILKKDRKDAIISEGDGGKNLRHFIMGTVQNDRMAAKIKISRPYDNDKLMRVWGWIPEKADVYENGWNREKIVDKIYAHLTDKYTLHSWREMNSIRDCKTPSTSDGKVFLHSLLELQESGDAV
jgi:CRISPR-associated protein Cmr1